MKAGFGACVYHTTRNIKALIISILLIQDGPGHGAYLAVVPVPIILKSTPLCVSSGFQVRAQFSNQWLVLISIVSHSSQHQNSFARWQRLCGSFMCTHMYRPQAGTSGAWQVASDSMTSAATGLCSLCELHRPDYAVVGRTEESRGSRAARTRGMFSSR
jgi:hypothetical protein